jgi:malate dehydrogenase (oxaloacetate-decarboxylating)
MVKEMAQNSIVFALANPTPEIMPDLAREAGARIVATGRSDFSNQINNSLVFPGLFRGVIDSKIKKITDEIKLLAATSLAESVLPHELEENYIIPDALDKEVAKNISACIINHVRKS